MLSSGIKWLRLLNLGFTYLLFLPPFLFAFLLRFILLRLLVMDEKSQNISNPSTPTKQLAADGEEPPTNETQTQAIDALEKVVSSQGLLDDIIDGARLGLYTIVLLSIVMIALLGKSTPDIFPITRPIWDFVGGITHWILTFPQQTQWAVENIPRSPQGFQELIKTLRAQQAIWLKTLPYKTVTIWFIWIKYAWESYLCIRQRNRLHQTSRPHAIRSIVSRQKYLESNAYSLDKSSLTLVTDLYSTAITTLKIVYNYYPIMWAISGTILSDYLQLEGEREITQSCIMLFLMAIEDVITNIPFSAYSTFIIEEKHGFNKQTPSIFITDLIKSFVINTTLSTTVISAFIWLVHNTSDMLYLYAWALLVSVNIIMLSIYTTIIQPLFNKVEPLPEGELRTAIEALASRVGFPLKKLYVIDGSKRSSHSNAYMYGFFKNKQIVLFDTLTEQNTTEETCSVLAHEIGHWKMGHNYQTLINFAVTLLGMLYVFSIFVHEKSLYQAFGLDTMPVVIGFELFMFVYSPLSSLLYFFQNLLSRKNEFQADAYAKKLGYAEKLKSSLIKLQIKNKGNMNPDPLYSAYHYSHPSLVERLRAIDDPNVAPKSE